MLQRKDYNMRIGYIRVSTDEQNTARQEVLMDRLDVEKVFIEKISGKDMDRPQLKEMLSFVREGDTVIVESVSRLSRSMSDFQKIIEQLDAKKVHFVSQKEGFDTNTNEGRLVMNIFASFAEYERSVIKQRQAEGIAIAKKEGRYHGRLPKPYDRFEFAELYKKWKAGDITQAYICKRLNISRWTLYRIIQRYEANNKK